MKRIEMVYQIKLFISECEKRGFTKFETSKRLLDFLEGCGMLPPKYKTGKWMPMGGEVEVNKWEPEE